MQSISHDNYDGTRSITIQSRSPVHQKKVQSRCNQSPMIITMAHAASGSTNQPKKVQSCNLSTQLNHMQVQRCGSCITVVGHLRPRPCSEEAPERAQIAGYGQHDQGRHLRRSLEEQAQLRTFIQEPYLEERWRWKRLNDHMPLHAPPSCPRLTRCSVCDLIKLSTCIFELRALTITAG